VQKLLAVNMINLYILGRLVTSTFKQTYVPKEW